MSNNNDILVEINLPMDDTGSGEPVGIGKRIKNLLQMPENKFGEMLDSVPRIANQVHSEIITGIIEKPSSISLEFGFSFKSDGKLYIVGIGTNSTFKLKLNWTTET